MAIYKPDGERGLYWAEFKVNGKTHRVPLATRDRLEAEQREKNKTAIQRTDMAPWLGEKGRGDLGFGYAADRYLWECAAIKGAFRKRNPRYTSRNVNKACRTQEGRHISKLRAFFGAKRLGKITAEDILKHQATRLEEGALRKKVIQETKRLFRLFRWADLRTQMHAMQDETRRGHWFEVRRGEWEYHIARSEMVYTLCHGWHKFRKVATGTVV